MSKVLAKDKYRDFLTRVSTLVEDGRNNSIRQVNSIITRTYWEIGRVIVEEEQKGEERAEYG